MPLSQPRLEGQTAFERYNTIKKDMTTSYGVGTSSANRITATMANTASGTFTGDARTEAETQNL